MCPVRRLAIRRLPLVSRAVCMRCSISIFERGCKIERWRIMACNGELIGNIRDWERRRVYVVCILSSFGVILGEVPLCYVKLVCYIKKNYKKNPPHSLDGELGYAFHVQSYNVDVLCTLSKDSELITLFTNGF